MLDTPTRDTDQRVVLELLQSRLETGRWMTTLAISSELHMTADRLLLALSRLTQSGFIRDDRVGARRVYAAKTGLPKALTRRPASPPKVPALPVARSKAASQRPVPRSGVPIVRVAPKLPRQRTPPQVSVLRDDIPARAPYRPPVRSAQIVPLDSDPVPGRSALDQGYAPGSGLARERWS